MKTILFDASIHFGQFLIDNEEIRKSCKGSQSMIKSNNNLCKAYYTYFENGRMDKVIRSLERNTQDTYYPFMDVFFSNKNISGLADTIEEMSFATMIATKFPNLSSSNAISCAMAVTRRVDEIHTLYSSMLDPKLITYFKENYNVTIKIPDKQEQESNFEKDTYNLEKLYQDAFHNFKANNIQLVDLLHDGIL